MSRINNLIYTQLLVTKGKDENGGVNSRLCSIHPLGRSNHSYECEQTIYQDIDAGNI